MPSLIADRVWCQRSERWQTNTAIVLLDGYALVCDPSWTPAEITLIVEFAARLGPAGVDLLITHTHEDHVCGIGAFPDACVLAGPATAAAIEDGSAAAGLVRAASEWGLEWEGAPFLTRTVPPGELLVGPYRLVAIEAAGHSRDGTAWLLEEEGVLLCGDYLSAVSAPLAFASVSGCCATIGRLREVLEQGRATVVVPGHGPVLTAAEAIAVADADLAYLDVVAGTASAALAAGLPPGAAIVETWAAVEPSRPSIPDLAVYQARTLNARTAVAEAVDRLRG